MASQPAGNTTGALDQVFRRALARLQARQAQQQAAQEPAHVGEERTRARLFGKAIGPVFEDLAKRPLSNLA
jgi:hypothetical protein